MKLAASYNIFDTEELLEASIISIRSQVDYINIVYQTTSNTGEKCSDSLLTVLKQLNQKGLVDEMIKYTPNLSVSPQKNEIIKRNIGLRYAKKNKCSHFFSLDSDEFYRGDQIAIAKKIILESKSDFTAVRLTNYFKKPIYRMVYKNQTDFYVSFIFKITLFKKFKLNSKFPVLVDPTRRVKGGSFFLFDRNTIEMHHMTLVRKDISSKLKSSSANKLYRENNINKYVQYFNNWEEGQDVYPPSDYSNIIEIKKVYDQFNISPYISI